MPAWLRITMVLAALTILVDVAVPPVIEDHAERGFCSADCPVQHPGHGAALAPAAPRAQGHRLVRSVMATTSRPDVESPRATGLDAPRAPPAA
jgi:hypothetical protein